LSALSPTVELGAQWPPMGIEAINPFELQLLNTAILLSYGVCHKWDNNCDLDPFWISGFSDAESSFVIPIYKKKWLQNRLNS